MTVDALIRAAVAAPIAVLLPVCDQVLRRPQVRLPLVGALIAGAMSPYLTDWRGWVVVGGGVLASGLAGRYDGVKPWRLLACVTGATVVSVAVTKPHAALVALEGIGEQRDVTVVTAGLLAAVFLGGVLIGAVLARFERRIPERINGLAKAGTCIGWLERTLFYMLFLAGAPDAAAIVVAGKSVARFPLFGKEEFAEYYLVGSLLSLGIAAVAGIGVRAVLGLHPLVPTKV
jgi:hypothetical protein